MTGIFRPHRVPDTDYLIYRMADGKFYVRDESTSTVEFIEDSFQDAMNAISKENRMSESTVMSVRVVEDEEKKDEKPKSTVLGVKEVWGSAEDDARHYRENYDEYEEEYYCPECGQPI